VGVWRRSVEIPKFDEDRLASSSLILADTMERVPSKNIGTGNFVIGNTKLTPRVSPSVSIPVTFRRGQNLNFWMQVYNLGISDSTKRNDATIEYQVVDLGTNNVILAKKDTAAALNPNADQLTLEKTMPLASLQPGKYQVTIKVNDDVLKQNISVSAPFNVIQ
jgi:hypothetical protein